MALLLILTPREAPPRVKVLYPWASCQIRKLAGCTCAGNAENVFSAKMRIREPDMHHGTCVTHVMHASIANVWFPLKLVAGKTFPSSRRMRNPQFSYLVRGPCNLDQSEYPVDKLLVKVHHAIARSCALYQSRCLTLAIPSIIPAICQLQNQWILCAEMWHYFR